MDIWVVAAAAGAGYVAQHWKDLMKSETSTSDSASGSNRFPNLEVSSSSPQLQEEKGPFRMLRCRKNVGKELNKERDSVSNGDSTANMPSTSGLDGEEFELMNNYKDGDVLSQSCLSPRFLNNYELGDYGESSKPSTRKIGSLYNRRILRSRRTNREVIKPVNSLQSCLMSQIYKDHAEMEDYMLKSSSSLARPSVRQLLVTDGSRIISGTSSQTNIVQTQIVVKKDKEVSSEEKASVIGVPPLPNSGSSSEVKTSKDKGGRLSNSSISIGAKFFDLQGSSHGAILFFLGISIGIMASLMSYRREVEKLSALLKQTKDLVQDLQEELDMKDSLTVKEIVVKGHESQDTHEDTTEKDEEVDAFYSEQKFAQLAEGQHEDCDEEAQEESMRKIEAELEAELATLELNMTSSTLDAQFSDLLELDEACVPDIAQGEFKANMFGRQAADESYADRDGTGNSTPHMINYAVSPRELSLRLHEVLESRLEERVKELETALQNSVKKNRNVESKHAKSLRQFSNSEAGSSSAQGSPTAREINAVDEVAFIHLEDDALHAYNEAYDEFTKVNGSEDEEEDLASGAENNHEESLRSFDQNLDSLEDDWENHFIPCHSDTSMKASPKIGSQHKADGNISQNDFDNDNDRDNDYESDEMEKLLIKQILEKTRQGSPAVLNARRILFSLDDH